MVVICEAALEPVTRSMSSAHCEKHLSSAAPMVHHLQQEHRQSGPRWTELGGLTEVSTCFRRRRRRRLIEEVEKQGEKDGDGIYQEEVSMVRSSGNTGRRGIEHHGRCGTGLVTAAATVAIFASSASGAATSAPSSIAAIVTTSMGEELVASRGLSYSIMSPTSFPYVRRRSHRRLLPRQAGSNSSSTRRGKSMTRVPGFVNSVTVSTREGSCGWRSGIDPPSLAADALRSELWGTRVAGSSRRNARAYVWGNHRSLPSTPAASSPNRVRMISTASRGFDGFSGELPDPPGWNHDRAGAAWKQDAARRRTSIRGEGSIDSRLVQRSTPSSNNNGNTRPLDSTTPEVSSPRGRSNAVKGTATAWTPKQEGQGSWDKHGTRTAAAGVAVNSESTVWRVDLKRGMYTGDVKIKQVCLPF